MARGVVRAIGAALLLGALVLLGACGGAPRDEEGTPGVRLGETRDDVLWKYGSPSQILLNGDNEVWIYDGSTGPGAYVDAIMRAQSAMLMSSTRATTTMALTQPSDPRVAAVSDVMPQSLRMQSAASRLPGRFTFDRKSDRLKSFTRTLPWPRIKKAGEQRCQDATAECGNSRLFRGR